MAYYDPRSGYVTDRDGRRIRIADIDAPELAHPEQNIREEPWPRRPASSSSSGWLRAAPRPPAATPTSTAGRCGPSATSAPEMVRRELAAPAGTSPEVTAAMHQRERQVLGYEPFDDPALEQRRREQMAGATPNYPAGHKVMPLCTSSSPNRT